MPTSPSLDHIPGDLGRPFVGHLLEVLYDNQPFITERHARYGPLFRVGGIFGPSVTALGPEANERLLGNKDGVFSSELGIGAYLAPVFPNSLMGMDGERHRLERRIVSSAFGGQALRRYLPTVAQFTAAQLEGWEGRLDAYEHTKRFALDLASEIFLGLRPGAALDRVNAALSAMIAATSALVRTPLPFTTLGRGVKARRFIKGFLSAEVKRRRSSVGGLGHADLLSQLCAAEGDEGERFTDEQIVDHTAFMWLAAHDTLASSFAALMDELARAPGWQERLREDCLALPEEALIDAVLKSGPGGPLERVEWAYDEVLRLHPPVGALGRVALRDTELLGYRIPAGAEVWCNIPYTQRMPELWAEPERFDPRRFDPAAPPEIRGPERPKMSWLPYGGGPHTCLGARYAKMAAKVFTYALLRRRYLVSTRSARPTWQFAPVRAPLRGVPIRLLPLTDQ